MIYSFFKDFLGVRNPHGNFCGTLNVCEIWYQNLMQLLLISVVSIGRWAFYWLIESCTGPYSFFTCIKRKASPRSKEGPVYEIYLVHVRSCEVQFE